MEIGMVSFLAALTLSPLVAGLARRVGIVSGSGGVRWSKEPKPLLGGISIVLAVLLSLIINR
jgi:UDP-N-acetylmuramyl pentapeptide phosphotransferase/UDP-N-acetylglucosamine-1-phosphate transferase